MDKPLHITLGGRFWGETGLCSHCAGIICGTAYAASRAYPDLFARLFFESRTSGTQNFRDLSPRGLAQAEMPCENALNEGFFVFIPGGVDAGRIEIDVNRDAPETKRYGYVILDEGASAELIIAPGLALNRRIIVGKDAKLRVEEILPVDGVVEVESCIIQEAGSAAETVAVVPGSSATSAKYAIDLRGPGANALHAAVMIAAAGEKVDIDVNVNHLVPDCHSDVLVKGIASGDGYGSFTGMVYVAPDAQRTLAYQQSRNLLLSDTARIMTTPQLEIYADDVKCSHGATVGQLNDNAVYYMRQRGLSERQARQLQLAGFVNGVLERIADQKRREQAETITETKLTEW